MGASDIAPARRRRSRPPISRIVMAPAKVTDCFTPQAVTAPIATMTPAMITDAGRGTNEAI